MKVKTKQLTTLSMLVAMAYVIGFYRVSFMGGAPFLTYDAKDVIIVLGGLMFGPIPALTMSVVLAFLEMVTHSSTGLWGMIMNALSSAAFACPAAYIYQKSRNMKGAFLGLLVGIITATLTMLLWNYLIVPLYTGWAREAVVPLLSRVFLPFNLVKTTLNAALVILVYKPVTMALKSAKLYAPAQPTAAKGKLNIGVMLVAAFVVLSLVLLIIVGI